MDQETIRQINLLQARIYELEKRLARMEKRKKWLTVKRGGRLG